MNSAFVGYEELSTSRGCYPPRRSASVDNTLLDLLNSSYPTQLHSLSANYFHRYSAIEVNNYSYHCFVSSNLLLLFFFLPAGDCPTTNFPAINCCFP